MRLIFLACCIIGFVLQSNAQSKATPTNGVQSASKIVKIDTIYAALDTYAKNTPVMYEKNIQTLADYLIKPAKTDLQKARVLFTWVATHIKYDDAAYNTKNYRDYSSENVLRYKKSVCSGYANLLQSLCTAAGLNAEKINGYCKGYSYVAGSKFTKTNHSWNAIHINGTWKLFDATWGSCTSQNKNGKLVTTFKFDPFWFDVNPKAFIFSHLPQQQQWQITEKILTLQDYEKLPYIDESFFKMGFNIEAVYNDAISGKVKAFVETLPTDYPIQFKEAPYTQTISGDKETKFVIESEYAEAIALIDDTSWHYFTKDNNTFVLSYKPTSSKIKISVRINVSDTKFSSVAKYKVLFTGPSH